MSIDNRSRAQWREAFEQCQAHARKMRRELAQAKAEAWAEGWHAAQQVVELDGVKVWAHTVFPEGYEGNPYLTIPSEQHPARPGGDQ